MRQHLRWHVLHSWAFPAEIIDATRVVNVTYIVTFVFAVGE